MIDPTKAPFYGLNDNQLEEFAIFCIAVAGKTAYVVARRLDHMFKVLDIAWGVERNRFWMLRNYDPESTGILLLNFGIGCWRSKGRAIAALVRSGLDLRTCSTDDLEKIPGIGPKTSRYFILHTRPGVEVACLDTHVLRYLRHEGYDVPLSTPTGKRYREIEKIFIEKARMTGKTIAEFDLWIWNQFARKERVNHG